MLIKVSQDLVRQLDVDHVWEFMSFSSYGTGTTSSGAVQMVLDLKMDIGGRDVLVVEDICMASPTALLSI